METRSFFSQTLSPLAQAITWLELLWWERALAELQQSDPAHADLPILVLRVHALKRKLTW